MQQRCGLVAATRRYTVYLKCSLSGKFTGLFVLILMDGVLVLFRLVICLVTSLRVK